MKMRLNTLMRRAPWHAWRKHLGAHLPDIKRKGSPSLMKRLLSIVKVRSGAGAGPGLGPCGLLGLNTASTTRATMPNTRRRSCDVFIAPMLSPISQEAASSSPSSALTQMSRKTRGDCPCFATTLVEGCSTGLPQQPSAAQCKSPVQTASGNRIHPALEPKTCSGRVAEQAAWRARAPPHATALLGRWPACSVGGYSVTRYGAPGLAGCAGHSWVRPYNSLLGGDKWHLLPHAPVCRLAGAPEAAAVVGFRRCANQNRSWPTTCVVVLGKACCLALLFA